MKSVLATGTPIIGSIPYVKDTKSKKTNGYINHKQKYKKHIKKYGVLFVGYNDSPTSGDGYFIFQNSWGKNWGTKGFGYLPYSEILDSKCGDLWVITNFSLNYIAESQECEIIPDTNNLQTNARC